MLTKSDIAMADSFIESVKSAGADRIMWEWIADLFLEKYLDSVGAVWYGPHGERYE